MAHPDFGTLHSPLLILFPDNFFTAWISDILIGIKDINCCKITDTVATVKLRTCIGSITAGIHI